MNPKPKSKSKPFKVHLKAMAACLVLILVGMGVSCAVPFIKVECSRAGDRVEFLMKKRGLGFIPAGTWKIDDLQSVRIEFKAMSGASQHRTTDSEEMVLTDSRGRETEILIGAAGSSEHSRGDTLAEGINAVLSAKKENFSANVGSLFSYLPLLPIALGLLLLALVLSDVVGSRAGKRSDDAA